MAKTEKLNIKELAGHRSSIYGFLAAIYRQELTSELLQQMKAYRFQEVLSNLGVKLNNGFFQNSEKELLENLAIEYTRLFVGPGKHISPHESVHHKKEGVQSGQLWGELTAQSKELLSLQDSSMNRSIRECRITSVSNWSSCSMSSSARHRPGKQMMMKQPCFA